jgi:hypothetical protein
MYLPQSPVTFCSRPKIIVEDGHLILEPRTDRNITFRTSGSGFVNVLTADSQKLVMLSAARGTGGGGALASHEDLVITKLSWFMRVRVQKPVTNF